MCQSGLHFSSRASPSEHKMDVNLHQLQKHAHSEMNRSQDLVLHFHSSLIESPLKPNQQLCSSLVSEVLSYPQGLGNGGQWVCYCFSLPLYPHIYVMSTVKWQRKLQTGEVVGGEKGKKKKKTQRGNNCYYDFLCVFTLKRATIVPVGMDAHQYEEWNEVNITYPRQQVKLKQQQAERCWKYRV